MALSTAHSNTSFVATGLTATSPSFTLLSGRYGVTATGTFNAGSVTLAMLSADGTTFVGVLAAALSAAGYATVDVPDGTFELLVTGSPTGLNVSVARISRVV
jgi:hypothetical protein